jgi:hypothetical protein
MKLALVLLGLALVLPAVPAQAAATATASTPTTLYFHIFDAFSAFPINTQQPQSSFFEVGGTSFPSIRSQGFAFNTLRGFATPGPVEYNFIESGRPRFHFEHGIAAPVQLDKAYGAKAVLYVDVRDLTGLNNAPNVLPSLSFHVAMREGNDLASDETLDAGSLILEKTVTAHVADLSACVPDPTSDNLGPLVCNGALNDAVRGQTAPDGLPILVPDAAGVVEVVIPLAMASDVIPKSAYNVRVDWWQNPTGQAQEDQDLAEGFLRFVSDATHHPRIELAVKNPVYIDYIHPEVAAGILLIHTAVNSPFGTYDVDVRNMTVAVTGPSAPGKLQEVVSQGAHVHNLHDKPAEVTWLWRYKEEGAKVGDYKIELKVPNLQGDAKVVDSAGFTIEADKAFGVDQNGNVVTNTLAPNEGKSSPGAGILVAGVLALCAAVARRKGGAP